jgi:hypothetical protein
MEQLKPFQISLHSRRRPAEHQQPNDGSRATLAGQLQQMKPTSQLNANQRRSSVTHFSPGISNSF